MCKFVAVNRVGKPCALVAHARFEMGAVDLEFLRSAAHLILKPAGVSRTGLQTFGTCMNISGLCL